MSNKPDDVIDQVERIQLLSLWLAGHYPGGPELIEAMLKHHIKIVRKLTEVNIHILKARPL